MTRITNSHPSSLFFPNSEFLVPALAFLLYSLPHSSPIRSKTNTARESAYLLFPAGAPPWVGDIFRKDIRSDWNF
ncbi:MAG: hypothetical protein CVU39_07890 [Chloroflexi bacterium HGW-Chloroflexi-10]|nr:MAG: hypothetical protein CVU39_07890 [Chloroflexi bacterium HGW-Chloroflexi-10]